MADLESVFAELASRYRAHTADLVTKQDTPTDLIFVGPDPGPQGREVWVGGVQQRKRYVSVHLMPVYVNPELLENLSPRLRSRMQGKSCFNFSRLDPELFDELEVLLERGLRAWRESGLLPGRQD
jgi:hypothetical protein